MKRALKVLAILPLLLVLIISSSLPVLAANEDKKTIVENYIKSTCIVKDGVIRYTDGIVKSYVSEKADSKYTVAVTLSDGKTVVYYNPSATDLIYRQANKREANSKVGEKVNDITENMGVEANTEAASIMLSGFKPILEIAIGIIVVLITFGMTLFSSFDIAYIAFPIFRNKMEDAKQSGNTVLTKKSANGDVTLRWVTDEAQYAVQQGTLDSGKSPWMIYFRKRIASYIFLAIILFILLTGNISIITNIAINIVSGIMDILSSIAS